ncbi:PilZ domain-containing protein [Ectothiorhodospiraceae bacterium 2226]|nr:PilZ domain-containing protein [Ectothiorhodospiraceae bacterium 2226]
MKRPEADKRAFARVEVQCEVTVSEAGRLRRYAGVAKNMSGRGVLFSLEREFPVGARLGLHIAPDNPVTPPLDAVVEVVRVEARKGHGFDIGGVIREVQDLIDVIPDDHAAL